MTSYVPHDVRAQVAERARNLCEYCLIAEANTAVGCQVDHVISEKHGGPPLPRKLFASRPSGRILAEPSRPRRAALWFTDQMSHRRKPPITQETAFSRSNLLLRCDFRRPHPCALGGTCADYT